MMIFRELRPRDLDRVRLVCTHWHSIYSEPSVWVHSFNKYIGGRLKIANDYRMYARILCNKLDS